MHCPYCQQEHPPEVKYCPLTGNPISMDRKNCPVCRGIIYEGINICPYCGHQFKKRSTGIHVYVLVAIFGLLAIVIGGGLFWLYLNREEPISVKNDLGSSLVVEQPTNPSLVLPEELTPVTTKPGNVPAPKRTPLPTQTDTPYLHPVPTWTPTPTETQMRLITPIAVEINTIDLAELVFVPAGEFLMGSDPDIDPYFWGAETPRHPVFLNDFWIYRTEVANDMYAKCVAEQKCPLPQYTRSKTRLEYYGNPQFGDYPVVFVRWKDASTYCKWAGGRLPTEAEWEKAARGEDGRLFAWGNEPPNSHLANYLSADTVAVGSYPAGASPYGAYDMSGNVREWVFDYYQATYYQVSPYQNPLGPATGSRRVYRGGHYNELIEALRVVVRISLPENETTFGMGFRCVVEIP